MNSAALTPEQIREEVNRILASSGFVNSQSLHDLLQFTVENTLKGRTAEIKETTLGLEVFHRHTSFDPHKDPIVRVQARKLRDRIAAFYETEGSQNPVRIEYVPGSYVPKFVGSFESSTPPRTIVVLPFANLGATHDIDYLCDGITEEVMYLLSRIHRLRVIARTSAFAAPGANDDLQAVGRASSVPTSSSRVPSGSPEIGSASRRN